MAQSTIQSAVENHPAVCKARANLDFFRTLHPGIDYNTRTLRRLLAGRRTRSRLNQFRTLHPGIDDDAQMLEQLLSTLALAESFARVAAHSGHTDPACPGCKVIAARKTAEGNRSIQTAPVVEPSAA